MRGTTATAFEFEASPSGLDDGQGEPSYRWGFGDGNEAEGAQATHSYSAPGTYTVELTLTDAYGRTSTATEELEVFEEVELPTPDDIAVPEEPAFRDELADRFGHPDDLYEAMLELDLPPALANFHLAVPVDLTPMGLGKAVHIPVQVVPDPQEGSPPHGRPSLYFIEAGTELLTGVYLTDAGMAFRYTERVTGEGEEAASGDLYAERLVTVGGDTIFEGFGELEVLDPDRGHGEVVLDRDANRVPVSDDRATKTRVWVLWSMYIVETESEEGADPDGDLALPTEPPVAEDLEGSVSSPDELYEALRDLDAGPRLLNFHAATAVDLSDRGLGAAVHVPVQILPEEDREAFHGRKSLYALAEGEETLAGIYFTQEGLALRSITRVSEAASDNPCKTIQNRGGPRSLTGSPGEGEQDRSDDVYRQRVVARDGTVVHDAVGDLEILDADLGHGRIVLDRTPDGERLEPAATDVSLFCSFLVIKD